jgi:hypothetical protein
MTTDTWTYEGFWNTVLSIGNAAQVVREFEFETDADLDEWLGHAESEAWAVGAQGGEMPASWAGYHRKALAELQAAIAQVDALRELTRLSDVMGLSAFEVGDRVETVGLTEEDSDTGIVHAFVAGDMVRVGWDSGVITTCPASRLRQVEVAS